MRFTAVSDLLDQLAPSVSSDEPAWEDVLARAELLTASSSANGRVPHAVADWPLPDSIAQQRKQKRKPRLTRRRALAAALLAVALTILFATPAFGLRALILDLFGRTNVAFTGKTAPLPVKRNFFDLSLGLPASVAPNAVASQTRRVGSFTVGGRRRVLWVAPTRDGGYCYQFDPGFGGCRSKHDRNAGAPAHQSPGSVHPEQLAVTFQEPTRRNVGYVSVVGGYLLAANAYSLTVKYANGAQTPLQFYYVSKPIDAGFFYARVPARHDTTKTRATAVELRDKAGHLLSRQPFAYPTSVQLAQRRARMKAMLKQLQKQHRLPPPIRRSPPLPPPSAPLQRGQTGGVSVVAGHNGVAVFETSAAPPAVQALINGRQANYTCLLRVPYHGEPIDLGAYRTTVARVAIKIAGSGVRPPFLGCEIQGVYGHTWPDRLHGHSAVEIAFNAAGARFFQDRATARDLALFVRSKAMHTIRKLSGAALDQQLRQRYGSAIIKLAANSSPLPTNRIGYTSSGTTTTFVEHSSTGRHFYVRITNGRINSQNVRPLAFVF
jgi:hypothetical protein